MKPQCYARRPAVLCALMLLGVYACGSSSAQGNAPLAGGSAADQGGGSGSSNQGSEDNAGGGDSQLTSDTEGVVPRAGLPHAAGKVEAAASLQVVYLGGSITKKLPGYGEPTTEWLQARYPNATITAQNSGINGTGSGFGAQRAERDIIAHDPDLVFVEFAVNDGEDRANEGARKEIERLVRKIWAADESTDIIFLYTTTFDALGAYREGRLTKAAAFHDEVADFYRIPSIALGYAVAKAVDAGKTSEDLYRDGTHPTEAGYALYNGVIQAALEDLLIPSDSARRIPEETLTPNLQLYPPKREALEPPAPDPLTHEGLTAQETYRLPQPGVHWIGQPAYPASAPVWKLFSETWQVSGDPDTTVLDGSIAADRGKWSDNPMSWLEEPGWFCGTEGVNLASTKDGGVSLGARDSDRPVLVFVPPQAGRYAYRVHGDSFNFWSHHKRAAMNVLVFRQEQATGESLAVSAEWPANDLELAGDVQLNEGDMLAFAVGANVSWGGGGAYVNDLDLRVGYMNP